MNEHVWKLMALRLGISLGFQRRQLSIIAIKELKHKEEESHIWAAFPPGESHETGVAGRL